MPLMILFIALVAINILFFNTILIQTNNVLFFVGFLTYSVKSLAYVDTIHLLLYILHFN